MIRAGKGFVDESDAEGHGFKGSFGVTDEPGIEPEDAYKPGKVTDDTEGHTIKGSFKATEPTLDEPEA